MTSTSTVNPSCCQERQPEDSPQALLGAGSESITEDALEHLHGTTTSAGPTPFLARRYKEDREHTPVPLLQL
ncbi:hypothetical protein G7K_5638-t1 [Saitoella complicata NRRL Y-17804]|uniref:Uncharacterized protein n=1 Tax=Saitoella complicata (strain BCRC 22490 / CBS 7301 / JCM 7358 / NBRC 10748 / NRRL Y-17804) TaxID=698492 RepID=A0A0E9NNX7_SAICN|nr:hypothetical protein G7K_5638-t1 [Saitoella complicata NRRL Y-17804]